MADKSAKAEEQLSQGKDPKFLCGVAVNVYQNSGDKNSNWAWFEKQKSAYANINLRFTTGDLHDNWGSPGSLDQALYEARFREKGPSVIMKGFKIGVGSDFWNLYEDDIKLAAGLGCNSMRISIEWSRLFPKRGQLDQSAVDRYNDMFDCMERNGIEAAMTLHWFVHPRWFDLLGGFTKAENIPVYVEWAETAFKLFGKRAKLWATFNEPGVAAMCGWIAGNHPPGKLLHFRTAGRVLMIMLRAHAAAYKAIRALPGGKDVQIGLIHNVFWTEPKGHGWRYAHARATIRLSNRIWGNESVMNYLKHGVFHHFVPLQRAIHWEDPDGKPGCDFFGVNHYSRGCVNWNLTPCNKLPGGLTDMGYPRYPPSLYRAISYSSSLGVPVYVMENGMASAEDGDSRTQWINGYLEQTERAVKDGYDVRGYMYWTLIDNFEWNFAWLLKFGVYAWDENQEPSYRKFRESAAVLKDWYKRLPDELGALLADNKGADIKPPEERARLEMQSEEDFLKDEGWNEQQIRKLRSYCNNPVVEGANSKWSHMEVAR